jgi:Holliday junction resolvase RusA-like endonuclease
MAGEDMAHPLRDRAGAPSGLSPQAVSSEAAHPLRGVSFDIPGQPVAKGRPRISTRGGFPRAYTPKKTANYEARVALAAQEAMQGNPPTTEAVSLSIAVGLPIAPSWSKKKQAAARANQIRPCSRPDIDNYIKAVFDGGNEIVWKDDSQIAHLEARKYYTDTPGISVIARWPA